MANQFSVAARFVVGCLLLLVCGPLTPELRAQLVPKNITTPAKPGVPLRPEGKWQGTARETLEGGRVLEYTIDLDFTGADDALKLLVAGTAKVPADGQELTVTIQARYSGTFRDRKLAMASDSIEVRVVETGQTVPSAPQRVEATLTDGVLQGRVGGDAEGWTTFTAKKLGAAPPAPAGATFAGRWRGTSREPGPDGRELSYPITIEFHGQAGEVRVEVAADLQYPTGDGAKTPVEYRATFRGRADGGALQARSDKVSIKLVAQNRTEAGPQQQLEARIVDGVMTGTIGGPGGSQDASRFELRPEGGVRPIRDETHEETIEEPKPVPPRTGGGGAAYATLVLQRREISDPGLGGVTSHTMSVPTGWQFTGGPVWTGNPDDIVDFVGELRGPAGESLHFVNDSAYRYSRVQSQQGVFDDTKGQTLPDGAIARYSPKQPGEVAVDVLLPRLRPGATNIRLVTAERLPKLEEAMRTLMKPQLDMIEALQAQGRNNGGLVQTDGSTWLAVERSRVRYEEQGVEWEEEVQCSLLGVHGVVASELMRSDSGSWFVNNVRTARAKVGELDARLGALWLCADSVRETPRWAAAVADMKLELMKAKTEAMRRQTVVQRSALDEIIRRGELAAKSRAEISDINMQTWKSTQDSLGRVHEARVDALGERQDFRSADGNLHTVTNHYDRAFRNSDNSIILTNDPNYRPAADARVNNVTWEEMQRVDPFRR